MSLFRFPFGGSSRRNASTGQVVRRRRLAQSVTSSRFGSLGAEQLEGRALLAAASIINVDTTLPTASYKAGQVIPIQVEFDQPVSVSGTIACRVNAHPGSPGALAQFAGMSAGGTIMNFNYTVVAGDNVSQFDVLQSPGSLFFGTGTITTNSTGVLNDADRFVANLPSDPTITSWKPGLSLDTVSPVTPTVNTIHVNPTVWSSNPLWAANHPDYFVITGTAGSGPLAAGETLTVTVNGATYTPTVSATGTWEVRIVPVGTLPATTPTSGALAPWSTTDKTTYPVTAKVTDSAGNASTAPTTGQVVIDMVAPQVVKVDSNTAPGTYKAGDVLDIYIQFNEPVRVVGTPTLILNVTPGSGSATPVATFLNVVNNEVHFTYTVQPGDTAPGFDYLNATSLINPGAIEDEAANLWLNPPLNTPSAAPPAQTSVFPGKGIYIDTVAPVVLAGSGVQALCPNGTYIVGTVIPITVTFSEPVFLTGAGIPTLTLALAGGSTATATYAAGTGTAALTFSYVVGSSDDTGLAKLDYLSTASLNLNGASLKDAAGNNAILALPAPGSADSLSGTSAGNRNIVVVAKPKVTQVSVDPSILAGTYSAGQTIRVWVTFDKPVTVKDGAIPYLLLNPTPGSNVAQWNGNYIDSSNARVKTPQKTIELEYLVSPSDTTGGAFLNYTTITDLKPLNSDAICYVWGTGVFGTSSFAATPSFPGYLAANLNLPAVGSAADVIGQSKIVIGPDTTAPLVPMIAFSQDTANDIANYTADKYTANPSVTVSGLETKSGTTWFYRYQPTSGVQTPWLTGGPISATGTSTFNVLSSAFGNLVYAVGSIEVKQIDWSGNQSPFATNSAAWTVDAANPAFLTSATLPDSGVAGDGITNNGLVTVTGLEAAGLLQYNTTYSSSTGLVSGPWLSVLGGSGGFAGGTGSFLLPPGTYDPSSGTGVVVRQQDLAGNSGPLTSVTLSGSSQFTVTIDTTPPVAPTISLVADTVNALGNSPTDGYTSNPIVTVAGLEAGATTEYRYQYMGGTSSGWVPFSGGSFPIVPNGVYGVASVEVRQTDKAGNVSPVAVNNSMWTIDTTNPLAPAAATLQDSGVLGDGITNNGLVTVAGLEAGALLQYNTNGTWISVPAAGSTTFTLPAATYSTGVLVRQQDLAGNFGPSTNVTLSGATQFKISTDASLASPTMTLASDTSPGFAPFNTPSFTTDAYSSNGQVSVAGLEVANAATGQTGVAALEYNIGGAWLPATITASTGTFTLPQGTYAPGTIQLRETDGAGNQVTVLNAATWTIDQTAPTPVSVSLPTGPFSLGQVVTITATFSETVYLSDTSPTLSLNIAGRAASYVSGNSSNTLTFAYTVQAGDYSAALAVTAFNFGTATIADKAGNALASPAVVPTNLGGPVVDATIRATSPLFSSTSPGPSVTRPVLNVPIQFSVPVRNFTIGAIKLYWNGRSVSLKGAKLIGTAANYTLYLPAQATGLKGEYRLEITGTRTGVAAITGGALMTSVSNIYWKRV